MSRPETLEKRQVPARSCPIAHLIQDVFLDILPNTLRLQLFPHWYANAHVSASVQVCREGDEESALLHEGTASGMIPQPPAQPRIPITIDAQKSQGYSSSRRAPHGMDASCHADCHDD
jgi:hypothetical protein